MIWLLWAIPCALANRIRGGWCGDAIRDVFPWWGTTMARLFVSGIIALPLLFTQSWHVWLVFWCLTFFGFCFTWSPWTDMINPLRDIIMLTLRGLVLTAPGGYISHSYIFGFSGALMGLSYYLGYTLPFHYKESDGYPWNGSDWGELLFGAVLGFGMAISLITGW